MNRIRRFNGLADFEQWLRDCSAGENWALEFKSGLREFQGTDEQKNKLRKCFAAFANGSGGYIIFGVRDSTFSRRHNYNFSEEKRPRP